MVIVLSGKYNKEFWIIILPIMLSILVLIAAPVIKGHPRYVFPIIYLMPIIITVLSLLEM